jgi:uncharacterized protein (TIGR03084 family)
MGVNLAELADDLRAETRALEELLDPLDDPAWDTPTPAPGWSIRDQVSHLAYFDEAAALAATDPDRFRAERDALVASVEHITEEIAARHRATEPRAVYAWFRRARAAMLDSLGALDPSTRVPWYGPDMSVASSLTARIMETWAHGQDVADALGARHTVTSALRQVAYIGVRTFANSFRARGLDVPDVPVQVVLTGPGGETWAWGEPAADAVRGDALEFCLVVTQRRHVADTALAVTGPVATQWMQVAQAFAGPPGPGRRPSRPAPA